MCDPVTGLMAASAIIGGGSQIAAGMAANDAGKANQRIREQLAADAIDRGEADVADNRRRVNAMKGRQTAALAAGNRQVNTGSSVDILADTEALGELDSLRIRNNAQREADTHTQLGHQSRTAGRNALTTGVLSGVGTLLTGGTKVHDRWKRKTSAVI